jgi:hypothetical protein
MGDIAARWGRAVGGLSLTIGLGFAPATAQADDQKDCTEAYVSAQEQQQSGSLLQAREQLVACAQERCHEAIRGDCVKWLREVEERLPSIVVAVKRAGGDDVVAARVSIDGKLVKEQLDGKAFELDPGPHQLRVEVEGEPPVERSIVVQEGKKSRVVELSVGQDAAPDDAGAPTGVADERGQPVVAYLLGGVGLVGLGLFAGFGLAAKSDTDELHDTCGLDRSCAEDDVDAARTKAIVADVSLGVGVTALAVGAALFIHHHMSDDGASEAARWSVAPLPGGAYAQLGWRF